MILAAPLAAEAQQTGRVYRIGVLETTSVVLNAANLDALRDGLRERGYFEGQTYVIEYRSADSWPERFPDLAAELVRLKVDLIVTRGTPAALAAKNATSPIPIVMAASGDPVGSGIVSSAITAELGGKRLELLRDAKSEVGKGSVFTFTLPAPSGAGGGCS